MLDRYRSLLPFLFLFLVFLSFPPLAWAVKFELIAERNPMPRLSHSLTSPSLELMRRKP